MSTASPTPSSESVLLVQCCHLPQFFYLAEKLRQRNPEWILSALVTDRPHVRFYLELFPPFDHLFFFDKKLPEMPGAFDQILFPLLNRGYLRIKRAARPLPGIAYEIDYQGERRALKLGTLVRSFAAPLHRPSEEFVQYLEDFPHRPLGEKVLVVETCHRSLADSSEEKWGRLIPDQAEVTRISVSTEGRGWRTLRRQSFDSGVVFFSGEKGFSNLKLLPFLLGIPKILVVNEHGDLFYATYRSLLRFLWGRVWQGAPLPKPSPRILVIQTESPTYVRRAIEVLRKPEMFPRSRICLLCRKEDADRFRNVSSLESVLTYSRRKVGSNVGLWRDLKGFDAVAAVFSGRGVFRKQKLLYFLLPIHHHLAFNARSDCYRLTPRTLFWTLRKDPSFFAAEKQPDSPILFLLSDEDSRARKAIEKLQDPKVVSPQPIWVFCREDKRSFYQALPGVEEVRTYAPGRTWENLKAVLALARSRVEVVSSIFSPHPAFRLQKLLFVLLPARHRLAFNQEDLNCYYLKGSHDRSSSLQSGERCSACCSREAGGASSQLRSNRTLPSYFFSRTRTPEWPQGHRKAAGSSLASTHLGLLPRGPYVRSPARGEGGSDLCSADLGELEGGSGPVTLPSRSRLLDLLSPPCFPAAETADIDWPSTRRISIATI